MAEVWRPKRHAQGGADQGERLARELSSLLEPERNAEVRARLRAAVARLGEGGASLRAADAVLRAVRAWKEGA